MKKTLSIILSLALLLGAVVVIPAFSVSAETVEFSDYAFNTTIFSSSKYNLDATNANNQINTVTNKLWLDGGAWIGSSRKDGLFLGANKKTSSLLEYNGVSNNDLTNFEWQFDLKSGHNTSANTAYMTFYFHVGENSTISTTPTSSNKVLGVSLCGSDFSGSCQMPLSLVPLYTLDNGIRPIDYTVEKIDNVNTFIPQEGYYLNLSDFTRVSGSNTIFKDITINIKLVGRELTITVWETGNVSTAKELTVAIPRTAFNNHTPSGDIAVANNSGSAGNMFLTNMSVKSGNYESGKASVYNYDWWASNTIYEKNSSTGVWGSTIRESIYHEKSDAIQLHQNCVADRLLETKGYLPTGGVENFVWGFDFTPGRTWGGRTSFAFHIDDTSVTNGVVTTEGDTVTNYVRPYLSRKNMIAVTFCSANTNKTSIELQNGIVIQQSDANGNMTTLETESGYITKGALDYPSQAASDLTSVNLNETSGGVFYSVRIVYYEGTVTVYMWKKGDTSTMFAVSAEIDESLVPAAGDFSIINFSNYAYLDNMFITSLDGDTTEAEAAVAHYENTYETITGKALCAHDYNGVIVDASTYFVEGSKKLECACGDILATGIKVPVAEDALSSCEEKFENGNLTITLTYSEALLNDIDNGAEIYFNYSIGGYNPDPIKIDTSELVESTIITLEGFNVDRLNAQLTYYLTADYTGIDTTKLAEDTTRKLTVANDVELDSKTSAFVNALNADGANTVVSAEDVAENTVYFTENTITADLKEGTMVLNFIASDELVAKLGENSGLARTNKITVTIDGVENEYTFTQIVMRKSTTIKISGMSFEQLNGKVTIKVEFEYEADATKNISDTITFEGAKAVEATNSAVATAFKNYIA